MEWVSWGRPVGEESEGSEGVSGGEVERWC
jgi:hypothetical protein